MPQSVKILVVGDARVGKTAVTQLFVNPDYDTTHYHSTLTPEFVVKEISLHDEIVQVTICDSLTNIKSDMYKDADGCIIVYDVTNPDSFLHADIWRKSVLNQIQSVEKFPFVLFGNRCEQEQVVNINAVRSWCLQHDISHFFVTARNESSIQEAFLAIISLAYTRKYKNIRLEINDKSWNHPDWYDIHDENNEAGSIKEPEHYKEFLVWCPPLTKSTILIDIGCGTGKVTKMLCKAYREISDVILLDPNEIKVRRAKTDLEKIMSETGRVPNITNIVGSIGQNTKFGVQADIAVIGSVLMPVMTYLVKSSLRDGKEFIDRALYDIYNLLKPDGLVLLAETVALNWIEGSDNDPVRRLKLVELIKAIEKAGFREVEVLYRYRDRVLIQARK